MKWFDWSEPMSWISQRDLQFVGASTSWQASKLL
jgi:hypothetical protein